MYEYSSPIKLARAKGKLGVNATPEEIHAEYVRIGGLVTGGETVAEPIMVSEAVSSPKKKAKKVAKKEVKKVTQKK